MSPSEMNADNIVTMVQHGQNPPSWQVYRARSAYFRDQILLGVFILAIVAAGAIYLLANPLIAFVPGYDTGSETLDPGSFMTARTIDFVVIGLLLVVGLVYAVNAVRNLSRVQDQVLVLMPDGFLLGTNTPVVYPFATMQALTARSYRGTITLTITKSATRSIQRVRLDGRFGNARQLAGQIMSLRNAYLRAQVGAQPPRPGQQ
jgi:hypothetical protein